MTGTDDLVKRLRGPIAEHAQRLIDRAFNNDRPMPRFSIPADPKNDSDLVVSRGIQEAADCIDSLTAQLAVLRKEAKEVVRPFTDPRLLHGPASSRQRAAAFLAKLEAMK